MQQWCFYSDSLGDEYTIFGLDGRSRYALAPVHDLANVPLALLVAYRACSILNAWHAPSDVKMESSAVESVPKSILMGEAECRVFSN